MEENGDQEAEVDACDYYKWTYDDLLKTCITSWYENRSVRSHAIPAMMRELPPRVVSYLKQDTMKLPNGVESSGTAAAKIRKESISSSDDDSDWDSEESEDSDSKPIERFDELDHWITESIRQLGGAVFPKVNSNSPKDATWVAFNKSLKCYVPGDIYLLLKCSSHISDVIDNTIYSECSDFDCNSEIISPRLILRKWVDISPAAEFRCFVVQNQLTGISQRDTTASYPSIKRDRDAIIEEIHGFFRRFSKEISLTHYVFDVTREGTNRILLVDLNVFGLVTDPCLFTYKELKTTFDEMLQQTPKRVQNGGIKELDEAEHFGNPVFKFIDNEKMLKFRSDVNAGPRI